MVIHTLEPGFISVAGERSRALTSHKSTVRAPTHLCTRSRAVWLASQAWPPPFFVLRFAFDIIHGSGSMLLCLVPIKTGELVSIKLDNRFLGLSHTLLGGSHSLSLTPSHTLPGASDSQSLTPRNQWLPNVLQAAPFADRKSLKLWSCCRSHPLSWSSNYITTCLADVSNVQ